MGVSGARPAVSSSAMRPRSKSDLFWSFSWLALQGFGGVLAVVQRELVEKKQWLTREEFVEDWAVAQIMPGPNVVNLSLMLGDRYYGFSGALLAMAGMLFFPMIIVLAMAVLYSGVSELPAVQGALRGMGAVTAGLITATGFKLSPALQRNPLGRALCWVLVALTFVAIGLLRIPLVWVLLSLGVLSCGLAVRALRQMQNLDARSESKP
ncbi:MAG: chromate transporter [Rhodoferax sp.]|nr:chromate transporter [Rhodoferax sp.]